MNRASHALSSGAGAALAAAALFGAGTPLAKLLLGRIDPWMLAALLYLGCGAGLAAWRALRRAAPVQLKAGERKWLAAVIACGGVAGPVLLMLGLSRMAAAPASLLLNAEAVFTALLAWFAFRENVNRRVAAGMAAIVAGAAWLVWPGQMDWPGWAPTLLVLGACLAWALDNNLTRKLSLNDASWIAMAKGLAAGSVNLLLALLLGAQVPGAAVIAAAGVLGALSYGASLALFVLALRSLGTARTGAYFSVAPFFGALLSVVLLGDAVSPALLGAGALMALGVWLHLSEKHAHLHRHEPLAHDHEHVHGGDEHHEHAHVPPVPPGTRHAHPHVHAPLVHAHPHFPDAHHRHPH